MDVEQLECFVAVAEAGHFGRAAERLYLTPSALSKRCSKLERDLGVRLFDRTTRRVHLSQTGEVMLDPVRQILADIESLRELANEASEGRVGRLFVAYSSGNGMLVAGLVHTLLNRNPEVEVHLEERLSADVASLVASGEASIGVCRGRRPHGLHSAVLRRRPLSHVLVPADHRLVARTEVRPIDLQGELILVSTKLSYPHSSTWRVGGVDLPVRGEPITSETQIIYLVAAGLGLSLVDEAFLERNPGADVVLKPFSRESSSSEMMIDYLVWRKDDSSALVRQFVDMARRPRSADSVAS